MTLADWNATNTELGSVYCWCSGMKSTSGSFGGDGEWTMEDAEKTRYTKKDAVEATHRHTHLKAWKRGWVYVPTTTMAEQ